MDEPVEPKPVLNVAPLHFIEAPFAQEIQYLPPPPTAAMQPQEYYQLNEHINYSNELLVPFETDSVQQVQNIPPGFYAQDTQKLALHPFCELVEEEKNSRAEALKGDHFYNINYSLDQGPTRRFMYGCIPVYKKSRNICLAITGFILVIMGIVIYLFFPRSPEMHFVALVPNSQKSFQLSNYDPSNPENFSFTMSMTMTVSVINTNWYHLKLDEISVKAFILANGTTINNQIPSPAQALLSSSTKRIWVTSANYKSLIATGKHGTMTFPPSRNVTFDIPLVIQYSPSKDLGLVNDPAFNEIIQLCVDHDSSKVDTGSRKTKIRYEAESKVGILKYIGYTPRQSSDFLINCPFQGSARDDLISSLKQKH